MCIRDSREVGITFVYVTHDQEEALTMSDRLAVMNAGHIEQVGAPRTVYDEPANTYVADFLGLANLLPATADEAGVEVLGHRVAATTGEVRGNCYVVVRPERLRLASAGSSPLRGKVEHIVFAGAQTHVHLRVGEVALQAMVPNGASDLQLVEGGEIGVEIAPEALRVLPN